LCQPISVQDSESPSNVEVSSSDLTSATITWSAVAGATEYAIYSSDTKSVVRTSGTTYTFEGLVAEQGYTAIVRTHGPGCYSAWSGEVSFSSSANPCGQSPSNVHVSSSDLTSATITWDAVPGAIEYALWSDVTKSSILVSTTSYTYNDLVPLKSYSVVVRTKSSSCASGWSSSLIFSSSFDPCPQPPQNLELTVNNGSNVTLTWDSFDFASEYQVWSDIDRLGKPVFTNSISYGGLTSGQDYVILVRNQASTCKSVYNKVTFIAGGSYVVEEQNFRSGDIGDSQLPTLENELILYPNPTSGELNLEVSGLNFGKVDVYNLVGDHLYSFTMGEEFNTDLTGLASGLYILKVTDLENGKTVTKQFVVN
jgi:hypothetical protein